jgi:tetratricopeptide (TPR) repeat protein
MALLRPPHSRDRLRDRDSADQIQRLQAALWAAGAGGVMGMMVGALLVDRLDWPLLPTMPAAMLVTALAVYAVARLVTGGAGWAAGSMHNPSGHSTPYRNDYSQATALVMQGDYRGAVALYREAIAERPLDPEPRIRMARVQRDHLGAYEEASRAFREARASARQGSRLELQVTRELVELVLDKMDDPPRAASELARLIERFPNTPEAGWARNELADIKRHIELA